MTGEERIRTLRLHAEAREGVIDVKFLHHEVEMSPTQARHFVREVLTAIRLAEANPRRPRIEVFA